MTLKEAKSLRYGDIVYHKWITGARRQPAGFRVVSIKEWKRSPDRIRIGLKYGLFEHTYMTENELNEWVLKVEEAFHDQRLTCDGHLEIKVGDVQYNFGDGKWLCPIQLCIKIQDAKGYGLIEEFSVPVGSDPKDFAPVSAVCKPSMNRGIIRMKRKAHKIFGRRDWAPLPNGKGIRTI